MTHAAHGARATSYLDNELSLKLIGTRKHSCISIDEIREKTIPQDLLEQLSHVSLVRKTAVVLY